MAYKGDRDSYLRVRVPQEFCTLFYGQPKIEGGRKIPLVDIKIPTENLPEGQWRSWVVNKNQVYYDTVKGNEDKFNIIDKLNNDTQIEVYNKTIVNGKRKAIEGTKEILTINDLLKIYKQYNVLAFNCPHCNEPIHAYSTSTCAGQFAVPSKSLSGSIVYRTADCYFKQ